MSDLRYGLNRLRSPEPDPPNVNEHAEPWMIENLQLCYDGALVRPNADPEFFTRPLGRQGGEWEDAAVHDVRELNGQLELLFIDPPAWVPAKDYTIIYRHGLHEKKEGE